MVRIRMGKYRAKRRRSPQPLPQPLLKITIDAEDIVDEDDPSKRDLIRLFIRIRDLMSSKQGKWIPEECKVLFRKDYTCKYMKNSNDNIPGVLADELIIPIAGRHQKEQPKQMDCIVDKFLRQKLDPYQIRFPCPAILFNGKYICRGEFPNILKDPFEPPFPSGFKTKSRAIFVKHDEDFLTSINVTCIVQFTKVLESDLEGYVAFPDNLVSIYRRIKIYFMPYPGRDDFDISLENLEKTTKCYLLRLLQMLVDGKGILIQTLSGHFRATLFISLLRLSLWADGVIHENLSMLEMAFLTLGYDWHMFGCRMIRKKCSSIKMMFLSNFLRAISTDEFSITKMFEDENKVANGIPKFQASRREVLKEMSILLLECYYKSREYIKSFKQVK